MPQDRIKDYTGGLIDGTPSPSPGVKDYTGGLTPSISTESGGLLGNALTTVAPVLDFLSRGQYASAGFFDAMINDNSNILDALSLAGSELVSPVKRRSFEDVIRRANPDFAANNPKATSVLGFLGDLALDPTSYLGVGLGAKGARVGGRALTTLGETMQSTARGAFKDRYFYVGLGRVPGRRLLPGMSADARDMPHAEGVRHSVLRLAEEAKTRLPKEVVERLPKRAAGFGYALEPESRGVKAHLSILRQVFGWNLPESITDVDLFHLAEKLSLERLGAEGATSGVKFISRHLSETEVIDSADRLISRLASEFPKLDREIFKPKGLMLQVGVPFTPLQKEIPLITANMLRAVGLDKLDGLWKAVAKLPAIKQTLNAGKIVRGAFDRFYDVDPRYVEQIIKPFENERSYIAAQVVKDADELLKTFDLDKEARGRVSRVMNAFDSGMEALRTHTAVDSEMAPEIFQAALRQSPLKPKEQALVMSLVDGYRRAAELEQAADVVGQSAANFDPRVFRAITKDADRASEWVRRNHPEGSVNIEGFERFNDLPWLRTATDIAHAVREGANLDQDAVLMYAARLMKARMALPKRQAEGVLRAIYGTADPAKLSLVDKKVSADWRYFGKMDLPGFRTEEASEILNFLDNIQRLWKLGKTTLNPGFALKQLVQNSFQSALSLGNMGWRAFDPRTFTLAATKTLGLRGTPKSELPEMAEWWLRMFTSNDEYEAAKTLALQNINGNIRLQDFAQDAVLTTPTGKKYTAEELDQLERQMGIMRGVTGVMGERANITLLGELGPGRSGKAIDGLKKIVGSYLGMASKVEDTSRRALFYNGLMMGDTPQEAARRVNSALFDYQRAHSEFEEQVMKRLIPFYSYTRFALPFALKQVVQNPGSIATTNKVLELVSDIYSADDQGSPRTLSREQLEMFMPKFLLDQPRIFAGWDSDGDPQFKTFNGMTPFDILSIFTLQDKHGMIDWGATAEKSIGGLLTPLLKIPAELLVNKEFFTQRVIDEAGGGRGRLHNVKDTNLDMILPESVKRAMGWEWAFDRQTGKYAAYVNPYLAYTMAQLSPPVARQFINLPDLSGGSIMELAMKQALGIGDPDLDIRQSLEIQNSQDRRYLEDLKQRIRTLRRQGRLDSAEEARQEYIKILQAVSEKRAAIGGAMQQLGLPMEETIPQEEESPSPTPSGGTQ